MAISISSTLRPALDTTRSSSPSSSSSSLARLPSLASARFTFRLSFSSGIGVKVEEGLHAVRATNEQALSVQPGTTTEEDVCELVSRLELTLGEGENAIDAYLVKAMKNNNGAAVLLLTDVFGFENNDTRDFAYRLSCFGYNVLVPDLFRGMPWTKGRPKDEFEDWRAKQPEVRLAKDIDTAADWLMEEMAAAGVTKKLGLLGFCFGGGRILEVLARDTQQRFATAVSFYPTRLDVALASQICMPILLVAGDQDELCVPDKLCDVAGQIKGSEARIYPGRGHAFAHCPGPDDDEDAEDAFLAMKSWFNEKLVLAS